MKVVLLGSDDVTDEAIAAFDAGWRLAAPQDSLVTLHIPETVESSHSLGIPDVSTMSATATLEHLHSGTTVVLGPRDTLDCGERLLDEATARWGSLAAARAELAPFQFGADDEIALRGLNGASARQAARVGDLAAQNAEKSVGAYTNRVERLMAQGGELVRYSLLPYSGAGGGAGFALLVLGGTAVHVRELSATHYRLGESIAASDLVVVMLKEFGVQELFSSLAETLAPYALDAAVPFVVVCETNHTSRVQRAELGIQGTYEVSGSLHDVAEHAGRIARTWSR